MLIFVHDWGFCVKVRKVLEELLLRAQELHAIFSETVARVPVLT
jgi:hypothetical protein